MRFGRDQMILKRNTDTFFLKAFQWLEGGNIDKENLLHSLKMKKEGMEILANSYNYK